MKYIFTAYKNISILSDMIMLKTKDNSYYVVGFIENQETIEQALNRLGITFDSVFIEQ